MLSTLTRTSSSVLATAGARLASTSAASTPISDTRYGGRQTVTLLPGDGIGPELADVVKTIFANARVPVDFEQINVNTKDLKSESDTLNEALLSLKRNKVGLKGTFHTPIGKGAHRSFNMHLRKELDLFANIVKCRTVPGFATRHSNVDLVVIRENTEGEYSGLEHQSSPGVVEMLKVITRASSYRIAKFAFDYAIKNNRKKVTAVHKANIMKLGDGLFLKTCTEVSALYPNIKFEPMIVDNASMQMVSKPGQFDVLVMPNLYGNIIGNIGAGLVGGAGIVPGINIGRDFAVFEPGARHVAKDIEGQNVANPTAMIFSSTLMLRHLNMSDHADLISQAVKRVIREGKFTTRDIGGTSTTTDFTKAVLEQIHIALSHKA
ncbi:isocitrate dehydrogenase subunit 1 [Capsaspora owczarzaki ATCC 30864]|uniref:Isocitrate dehydrogenase subunit 1 n=1 Tax=Capsaspora owczarzaki (strain ATCC 30864) TaxID=595528 RepID=A0A0D2UDA5_CAPO3|nr:isocitrate dehydrogenase subunit 1 [Capsaspora owczarzaki ATCC 30864]KJE93036.1 isocitrate dehydrogenase subunit 1 [Capsaspora owczarzaki ATCC 30864]|eukprot:XP_004363625.1 isocitrate dehydrogenase subunit 1 [Capsaspora owczarzaki ATCC 30864]